MRKEVLIIELSQKNPIQKIEVDDTDRQSVYDCLNNLPEGTLSIFPANKPDSNAVIMCPGGGFNKVNMEHEGYDFAAWFNALDITYAILKYHLPDGNKELPLQDMADAPEALRRHLPKTNKVGVMGASIGGYIAARTALSLAGKMKPDFQILMYSVFNMEDAWTHRPSRLRMFGKELTAEEGESYSLEDKVTPATPPAFIVAATDDRAVSPMNSLRYCQQLVQEKVPVSFHLYPTGGHSFGFNDFEYKEEWLEELKKWLKTAL